MIILYFLTNDFNGNLILFILDIKLVWHQSLIITIYSIISLFNYYSINQIWIDNNYKKIFYNFK